MNTAEKLKTIVKSLFRVAVIARALGILWAIITAYYLINFGHPIQLIVLILPALFLLGIAWHWEFVGGVLISILGIYFGVNLFFDVFWSGLLHLPGVDFGFLAYVLLQIVVGVLFCHIGWRKRLARHKAGLFND